MTELKFDHTGQQVLTAFCCYQVHVAISEDRRTVLTHVNSGKGGPKGYYVLDIADATWHPVSPDDIDLSGMWHVRAMRKGDMWYEWERRE